MKASIESLIREAIEETLQIAKHQAEKQRSIDNINAESIYRHFVPKIEKVVEAQSPTVDK